MLRSNPVDLYTELSTLTDKRIFPKERALLKAKKQGLEKTLDAFSSTLAKEEHAFTESLDSPNISLQNIVKSLNKILEMTYLFLVGQKNKKQGFLSTALCLQIGHLINIPNSLIMNRISGGDLELKDKLELSHITLLLFSLMHKDFYEYKNNKLIETDVSTLIPDIFQRHCEWLLEEKNITELEKLLRLDKKLLLSWKIKLGEPFLAHFNRHYIISTQLAFLKGDYQKARSLSFKCIETYERAGNCVSHKIPILFKECATKAFSHRIYSDALLFAELGIEAIELTEFALGNHTREHFAKFGIYTDVDVWRADLKKDKNLLTYILDECKKKMCEANKEAITKFSQKKSIGIEWQSENQFLLSTQEASLDLDSLVNELNRANIICYLDTRTNKLVFDSLIDIKIDLFKKIISSWLNQIQHEKLRKITEETIRHAETFSAPLRSGNTLPTISTTTSESEQPKKEIKEKVTKPATSTNTTIDPHRHDISWGENYPTYSRNEAEEEVYKLYGQTAHNQYLFINHGFFSRLNIENPDAARTLVNICGRGKVINDSQSNKGIIIEGKDVKIKDSSKAYRFFGHVVTSTVHHEKTCQLIEIDNWHPDPH